MNDLPIRFWSTTLVSTRFSFGKRIDSSVGLGASAFGGASAADGFGDEPQEASKPAKARTKTVAMRIASSISAIRLSRAPAGRRNVICSYGDTSLEHVMKNQESNKLIEQNNDTSRRDLLRTALAAAAVIGGGQPARAQASGEPKQVGKTVIGMPFEPRDQVRMGLVGAGGRGTGMLKEYLAAGNLQVTAVCDVVKDHALNAQSIVERAGQKPPAIYTGSDTAFENLAARDDIDFVYIATPWVWHVPAALAAMSHGMHAFIEVPAATTLEDCWKLVNTSEQTRRHCLICENCCYGYNELMILNMVRDGAFGDLYHGEGAYLHDLRRLLFADEGEGLWRRFPHTKYNGNLYPTHGLGPVANYMSVNRGDRFDYMVSMSSRERGLDVWREANVPKDSPKWKEKYICGDMSTSLIRTVNGLTIVLKNDTVN